MKVFIEEQKFTQPLVIIGLIMAFIVVGISSYNEWETISEGTFNEKISSLGGLIIILLVAFLFLKLKLKTRVDEKGIYYQYFPLHLSYKLITWETIASCYVRRYNAVYEFGGWGMKYNFFRKTGKSFTTKGNIGLQIELTNANKILIGTQKKEELQRVLNSYQDKINSHEN